MILPIVATGLFSMNMIQKQFSNRIEVDLANIHRLEAARIRDVLRTYKISATRLSRDPGLTDQITRVVDARRELTSPSPAANEAEFQSLTARLPSTPKNGITDGLDALNERPLQPLVDDLFKRSTSTGSPISDIRLVDAQYSVLGETDTYSWKPYDGNILPEAINNSRLRFGNAFRSAAGKELLPVIVPVRNDRYEIAGALIAEMDLGQVVNAVVEHEGFGETSEAHIAQPTATGDAEFITLMRFARNAAFNKVVPRSKNLPINWSLESTQRRVVKSPDYRSIPSFLAIQTLPETGWGLVVKIDENEALAPVFEIR